MAGYTEEDYERNAQEYGGAESPQGSRSTQSSQSSQGAPKIETGPLSAPPGRVEAVRLYSPEQQRMIDAVAGYDRPIKLYRDWLENESNRSETEEERQKRERKERSKRIIAAVSDGLSALGNLYFTSQYAPNMYNPERSAAKAVDERIERLKAERERKRDQYMNYAINLGNLENQRAATVRELEAQQERQKMARQKARQEAQRFEWEAALQGDRAAEQKGRAAKETALAEKAKAEAEYAPELQKKKGATEDARAASYRTRAAADIARAGSYNTVHHFMGKTYPKGSKDYEKDVTEAARLYNERHSKWQNTVDRDGNTKRMRVNEEDFEPISLYDSYGRKRDPEEYAGEVETRIAQEKAGSKGKGYGDKNNRGY